MLYFSKSRYCEFKQCPKAAWLHKFRPETRQLDEGTLERMATGNAVGDLAMGLFGDYVEVAAFRPDGRPDFDKTKVLTRQYMAAGKQVICEAAFGYQGLYCAVDILKKTENGYTMYEVKSSTTPAKPVYILDACFQKYILEKCGVKVEGVNIVTLEGEYVRGGDLDIQELFRITDVSALVEEKMADVEEDLRLAEEILSKREEPCVNLSSACHDPYDCAYWDYCTRDLPKPSVFDLYGVRFKAALIFKERTISPLFDIGIEYLVEWG